MANKELDNVDIRGNLETIAHLAQVGMIMIDLGKNEHIPTILEDLQEHIQRLVLDYAVVEDEDANSAE